MFVISMVLARYLHPYYSFFQNRVRTWIAEKTRIPVVMVHAIVAPRRVLYVMLARNFLYAQMAHAFAAR